MNLIELLRYLQKNGAPEKVIWALEKKISQRELRIKREEENVREWLREQQEKDEKAAKNPDMLLIMLIILLLEEDSDDDEFQLSDLLPSARKQPQDKSGFMSDEPDSVGCPKW